MPIWGGNIDTVLEDIARSQWRLSRRGGRLHCNPPPTTGLDAKKASGLFLTRASRSSTLPLHRESDGAGRGNPTDLMAHKAATLERLFC